MHGRACSAACLSICGFSFESKNGQGRFLHSCPVAPTPAERQIEKLLVSMFFLVSAVPSVRFLPHNRKQVLHIATGNGGSEAEGTSGTNVFQRCLARGCKPGWRSGLGHGHVNTAV